MTQILGNDRFAEETEQRTKSGMIRKSYPILAIPACRRVNGRRQRLPTTT